MPAGVRGAQRGGPARPGAAQGAAGRGWVPVRRQGLRPARGSQGYPRLADQRRDTRVVAVPEAWRAAARGRGAVGRGLRHRQRGRICPGPLRPHPVRPLHLRDDGAAQGDPAFARRPAAGAPQMAGHPGRHGPGRCLLLVQHHRLDCVEPGRFRAAHRGVSGDLRRQPDLPGPQAAVAARRGLEDHAPRCVNGLPDGLHASRAEAGQRIRSV